MTMLLISVASAPCAVAQIKSGDLSGGYGFYGDQCEENNQADPCVVTIQINGGAAREIYNRMPDKALPDECTGGLVKEDNNGMRCYKEGKEFSCDFGYSFSGRKMVPSNVTC